ncbi:MAG: hypothetical protein GY804_02220 [Alphaproteobacteria bacterium]|nr:hypothetical protein [Alphaproteobacteria bacterium]
MKKISDLKITANKKLMVGLGQKAVGVVGCIGGIPTGAFGFALMAAAQAYADGGTLAAIGCGVTVASSILIAKGGDNTAKAEALYVQAEQAEKGPRSS